MDVEKSRSLADRGILTVPAPVKAVFKTFPVAKYTSIASITPASRIEEGEVKWYYEGKNVESNARFDLGCYGIVLMCKRYVPTDPLSLAYAILLAEKNHFRLPRDRRGIETGQVETNNCAMTVNSHHASPNNQLPMLIETTGATTEVRTLRKLALLTTSKLTPPQIAIDGLLDYYVDLWLLLMLLDQQNIASTFSLENLPPLAQVAVISDVFSGLFGWNGFRQRNPNLFTPSNQLLAGTIGDYMQGINSCALASRYSLMVDDFREDLAVFEASLDIIGASDVLTLKLAGLLLVFTEIISTTAPAKVVREFPRLVDWAREVLNRY